MGRIGMGGNPWQRGCSENSQKIKIDVMRRRHFAVLSLPLVYFLPNYLQLQRGVGLPCTRTTKFVGGA